MNEARRKELARAGGLLSEAAAIVAQVADEERGYYDNMPESLQAGEKGELADEVASNLEELAQALEDGCSTIDEARGES